jgi:hypothetical protein
MTADRPNDDVPAMPFNEALKRVWSAPPMHKTKPKPAAKPAQKKPAWDPKAFDSTEANDRLAAIRL